MKKKVLFNCSTNIVGGGVKNSALFITKTLIANNMNWIYAISPSVKVLLQEMGIELDERFFEFKESPSRCENARKELRELSRNYNCQLVYTMAGPAYVKFPVYHIQGISNAYITHAGFSSFALKGFFFKVLRYFLYVLVQFYYSRKADYFVFQTEQARNSFIRRRGTKRSQTKVINNAFDKEMLHQLTHLQKKNLNDFPKIVFCPGANYIHKAFQFIPQIVHELKKMVDFDFQFVLTLNKDSLWERIENESKSLDVIENILNIGPYSYSVVARLYQQADLIFVPSLLETFSASYMEAIAARKPLLVADKNFAREVCLDYAEYCQPRNARLSAMKIAEMILNPSISEDRAVDIIKKYGDQEQRFQRIIQLIEEKLNMLK